MTTAPTFSRSQSISTLPLSHSSQAISRPVHNNSLSRLSTMKFTSRSTASVPSSSKLPATDSLSYFPPFEAMGSGPQDEDDKGEGCSSGTTPPRRGHHTKGRSLGSIAGLMSASLSWGLSSLSTSSSSSHPDGEAVEALSRKFSPAKRRVLEPLILPNNEMFVRRLSHKRRMKSEMEVERIAGAEVVKDKERVEAPSEEAVVEGLISEVSTAPTAHPQRSHHPHHEKPTLSVPLPQCPTWRFPLRSPPITSLSPEIPLSAFRHPVENPASVTSFPISRETSPTPELDQVELDLLPSPLTTSPDTPRFPLDVKLQLNPSAGYVRLERSTSVDSRLKIRAEEVQEKGDLTPKAGKGWKEVAVREILV